MRGIAIGPLDRFRSAVVMPDIAHELAGEIGDGGKDTECDDVTLDLGEPDFNLVEPGRVGRREVQMHIGMLGQEITDPLSLMSREVVENDVDLFPLRLRRPGAARHRPA